MKRTFSILIALLGWFAVVAQYFLMIENRLTTISETSIRFFSYFTILTNSLCAIYFTSISLLKPGQVPSSKQTSLLTPITVYITVVGLVYQVVLRPLWEPQGMQRIVDELLHSIIPAAIIVFWYFFEDLKYVRYSNAVRWLIYPLVYSILILIRGYFSAFYPYPFIDVLQLGFYGVFKNAVFLMLLFVSLSLLFIFIGKKWGRQNA